MKKYRDFDLLIQLAAGGYQARVVNSPGGEGSHFFEAPFQELEIENYLFRFNPSRQGVRGAFSSEEQAAAKFGEGLFKAVFRGDVQDCLIRSLDETRRSQEGLRIRLRLTDVPELASLPWEYLYDKPNFFALSSETPIIRYQHLTELIEPLEVTPPLRVLVMISSPSGYPRLKVGQEWGKLQKALRGLEERGLVKLERMHAATLPALQEQLRQATKNNEGYHIFHFIGHGAYLNNAQSGILILENDKKQGEKVSGITLGTYLRDHRSIRLVVLNACEGARASTHDPFAGTAQSLVQKGIPAVIAMQFSITDTAAITFAKNFYAAIADTYPVDAALSEARRAIYGPGDNVEWGTPVLYLRAPDGQIFNIGQTVLPISAQEVLAPAPVERNPATATISGAPEEKEKPQPEAESLLLAEPQGVMDADSPFYIARDADAVALSLIKQPGGRTFFLKAPGQMGRSTLLSRVINEAEEQGKHVAHLDFQLFDKAARADYDTFFRQFCTLLTDAMSLDNQVEKFWQEGGSNSLMRCTRYLSRYLLAELRAPLVLAMDEVDAIYDSLFRSDFFTMLRNWSNSRATNPIMKKLDIVFVTAAERQWLITEGSQSDFNVGTQIDLKDFTPEQVTTLNTYHRQPMTPSEIERLLQLTGGHPYLVRRALYEVAAGYRTAAALFANATDDDGGPFGEHLKLLFHHLYEEDQNRDGLSRVISGKPYTDQVVIFRLQIAGLVRKQGLSISPRCNLYADYFRKNFNG